MQMWPIAGDVCWHHP